MALHLQKIYNLRPADAIQLASARVGAENPSKVHFLCLDEKLNEAAKREDQENFGRSYFSGPYVIGKFSTIVQSVRRAFITRI